MNAYRLMAIMTCAAGLSVTACTAGVATTPLVTAHSPTTSPTTSPSAASSSGTVSVSAPIGSFPIPNGAQVMANTTCDKEIIIELGSVTPKQASSFYLSALPRGGYKITGNTLVDGTGDGVPESAEINFTGHGYKGQIAAVSDLGELASMGPSPVSVPSSIAKNFFTITLTPPGGGGCASSTQP